jgi:hypothetical protein
MARRGKEHGVDPKRDLVPLCPNCHAVVHLGVLELDTERKRTDRPFNGGHRRSQGITVAIGSDPVSISYVAAKQMRGSPGRSTALYRAEQQRVAAQAA